MKYIKKINEFFQPINEEWFPSGPFLTWNDIKKNTTYTEVFGHKIVFIAGEGEHLKEIDQIINTLYKSDVESKFKPFGFKLSRGKESVEYKITSAIIYKSNLKGTSIDDVKSLLGKYGEFKEENDYMLLKLNKPINMKFTKSYPFC